jgi:hypothetical protein
MDFVYVFDSNMSMQFAAAGSHRISSNRVLMLILKSAKLYN